MGGEGGSSLVVDGGELGQIGLCSGGGGGGLAWWWRGGGVRPDRPV